MARETDLKICEEIQNVLDQDTAAFAFIAPYIPKRISPQRIIRASISIPEELEVEDSIIEIKKHKVKNLYLLLNSFGGGVTSSYKIAKIIRDNFEEITVFVPHIAASGATLIALSGNKLIMGEMSHLTPIDLQMERDGKFYSVNAMIRSFGNLNGLFETTSEEDAPYPWKAIANKLDPVELQEWIDASNLMEKYAKDILNRNKTLQEQSDIIISRLSKGYPTHTYAITVEEAKEIFRNDVVFEWNEKEDYSKIWGSMRKWLRKYVMEESGIHFIKYILPKTQKNEKQEKSQSETH